MTTHRVFLFDRHTGQTVEAELVDVIDETHLRAVEAEWKPILFDRVRQLVDQGRPRQDWPPTWHWDWREKLDRIKGLLAFDTFALQCQGQLQGLMQVNTAKHVCRIPQQAGKHLAYVDYVETAPWNRPDVTANPRYKGVGTVMIRAAIELSHDQNFRGRIGLHSVPRAEAFYAAVGMTDLGIDGTYENLKYFEMTPEQAAAFSS